MAKKGRDSHFFVHGLFAGYADYRYSTAEQRPKKHEPIYRGEKRRHVVDMAMDMLREWRQSPFEFEGAARASIRSALCLQGYDWHRADHQAADVVTEALRLLGAVRPTWEQGQRNYVEPRENCRNCGTPLDDEDVRHGFCSVLCARAAITRWDFDTLRGQSTVYKSIHKSVRALKLPKVRCQTCNKSFRPNSHTEGKFCSPQCAGRIELPSFDFECQVCGTPFQATRKQAAYCCDTCKAMAYHWRKGPPTRLTPLYLDYLFRQQGLRITGEKMAA